MEYKSCKGMITKTNDVQGIINAIFSVFGTLDLQNDITHRGAFLASFARRGHKVKILDNHRTDSINAILGKPLMLRELSRGELPPEILSLYPDATGGAFVSVQFLMDTENGRGAYTRLAQMDSEWSFGYDVLEYDFSEVRKDGKKVRARNLRTLELYEISPVIFGAMPATMTVDAKSRRHLDPLVRLALFEREWEKLDFNGRTRTELLAEVALAQAEIAELI